MRAGRIGLALLLVATALHCAGWDPLEEQDPAKLAVGLFGLLRQEEPSDELLDRLFAGKITGLRRAELLDALTALGHFPSPGLVQQVELSGPDDLYLELASVLAGGGQAMFAFRLARSGEVWEVRWFQGPGVEWPRPGSETGERLTTSAPPG